MERKGDDRGKTVSTQPSPESPATRNQGELPIESYTRRGADRLSILKMKQHKAAFCWEISEPGV